MEGRGQPFELNLYKFFGKEGAVMLNLFSVILLYQSPFVRKYSDIGIIKANGYN